MSEIIRYTLVSIAMLAALSSAQIELQCPSQLLTVSNGMITFSPLSDGSGPVDASYNPSLVSRTWFSLANGFVDIVRSGGLPYDLIIPAFNQTFLQSSSNSSENFDPLDFLENFVSWWAGILAVTLVGILVGLCFCLCGGVYCCCRCCRKCGGDDKQKHRKSNDCLMFSFGGILAVISVLLLVAAILSFTSNDQTYQVLDNIEATTDTVIDDVVLYARDTIQETFQLVCQLISDGGVVSSIFSEVEGTGEELFNSLGDVFMRVLQNEISLNTGSVGNEVENLIDNIAQAGNILLTTSDVVITDLGNIALNLANLLVSCAAAIFTDFDIPLLCTNVVRPLANTVTATINALPDLSNVSPEVMMNDDNENNLNIFEFINLFASQFNNQTTSVIETITDLAENSDATYNTVKQALDVAKRVLRPDFPSEQCPPIDGFQALQNISVPSFDFDGSSSPTVPPGFIELSLGYVRECIVSAGWNYLRMFDTYRYVFGIVVCCLSLIITGLVWLGLLTGLLGFKKGRSPSERTKLSNCGGIFLLIAIGVTFVFGFFLLVLSSVFFFFGANSLKICQALQGPNYDIFAQTIDQEALRDTVQALTGNSSLKLEDVPQIFRFLRQCEQEDTALFTALNLQNILSLPDNSVGGAIRSVLNITEIQSTIDDTITDITGNFDSTNFANIVENGLDSFETFIISGFNATAIKARIERAEIQETISESITELEQLRTEILNLGSESVANEISNLIANFESVRDNAVPTVLNAVDDLADIVEELAMINSNIIRNISGQIAQKVFQISEPLIDDFINDTFRELVSTSVGYADQYIDHFDTQIMTNVGGCQPLYGVYTQIHNVICRDFVDGLNGFWWSLGLCAVLYIPLIVFATLTTSFFKKKRVQASIDDKEHEKGNYSLKAM